MKKSAYARAGVDLELGNAVKRSLPELLASTHRPEVLGQVGGFGGLFALNLRKHKRPVMVSSVDGVGTKLKIAFEMDVHHTIGQDLVNHCVDDILVLGAEPLFFLDYLGTGKLKPHVFEDIVKGFAIGCADNHCSLIGGETAQMPGFYQIGEYDVSGTIVGVVDQTRMLNGQKTIKRGDVVIGIASNGLHTNGYSLARKVLQQQMNLKLKRKVSDLGCTLGEELLRVHRSYFKPVNALLKNLNRSGSRNGLKGLAHITGGGFIDNIPRVLPPNLDCVIEKGSWDILPIFNLIQRGGRISEDEMYHVFNMGVGMVAIVSADKADSALRTIRRSKHEAWIIGEIKKGKGKSRVV
jgi:phosphoribosylformylglycinamidine cyclo-ligase